MAIYQFYLAVIPKSGLLKMHGEIPLEISISTSDGYFKSNTEKYWNKVLINSEEIIQELDSIIDRASWGNDKFNINWKIETEQIDNDVWMSTDEKYGHIKELSFRADLRDNKFEFLINMIHLARKYDWIFMDRNGKLANPSIEIIELIKNSNAHKFLSNPMEFIKGLNL